MADARSLVEGYFQAWQRNDFTAMRSTLDDAVAFAGPIDTFDNADAFVQSITGLSQIVDAIVIKKTWADGPDVLIWYELHTKIAPPAAVAEWHHVDNGKVTMVRVVFDARPFAQP